MKTMIIWSLSILALTGIIAGGLVSSTGAKLVWILSSGISLTITICIAASDNQRRGT